MGSYLEIDNRETNSKTWSGILIDAIRDIDTAIMQSEYSSKKDKKCFIPDYYKTDEDGKEFGCGNWIINKRGMAALVSYLRNKYEDDSVIRALAIENHKYYLENVVKEEDKKEKIIEFTKSAKDDMLWCINYTLDILLDMILTKQKCVYAMWV